MQRWLLPEYPRSHVHNILTKDKILGCEFCSFSLWVISILIHIVSFLRLCPRLVWMWCFSILVKYIFHSSLLLIDCDMLWVCVIIIATISMCIHHMHLCTSKSSMMNSFYCFICLFLACHAEVKINIVIVINILLLCYSILFYLF